MLRSEWQMPDRRTLARTSFVPNGRSSRSPSQIAPRITLTPGADRVIRKSLIPIAGSFSFRAVIAKYTAHINIGEENSMRSSPITRIRKAQTVSLVPGRIGTLELSNRLIVTAMETG